MKLLNLSEADLPWLLRLPWTIRSLYVTDETPSYWCLRCAEIPSAIATGESEAEVEKEFWESLRESLHIYLIHDDPIPVPDAVYRLFVNYAHLSLSVGYGSSLHL